jgi:hypothetical protein
MVPVVTQSCKPGCTRCRAHVYILCYGQRRDGATEPNRARVCELVGTSCPRRQRRSWLPRKPQGVTLSAAGAAPLEGVVLDPVAARKLARDAAYQATPEAAALRAFSGMSH